MTTIAPLLQEAERYLGLADLDRAAELCARAHQLDAGRSPLPTIGAARVALALGRKEAAAALLDRVLAKHPRSVEALTLRGVAAEAHGDVAAAHRWLEAAVAVDRGYGPAQANLGRVLAQERQWPQAAQALRAAAEAMPGNADALVLLGTAEFRAGRVPQALVALSGAVQADPRHLDALVTLADVLVEADQADVADALLENALPRVAAKAVVHGKRAALALRRGDVPAARRHAAAQVEAAPGDVEGWLFAATLAMAAVDLDDAERCAQQAVALAPGDWRGHYHLGGVYEALRLKAESMAAYRKAASLGPDAWRPRNNLAALLLERPTPDAWREAKVVLEEALRVAPPADAALVQLNLALATRKLGDVAASERHARAAAASSGPVADDARRLLGDFRRPRQAR